MTQFDHPHIAYMVGVTTIGLPYMLHMAYYEHGLGCKRQKKNSRPEICVVIGNLLDFLKERSGFLELALSAKLVIMHDVCDGMAYLEGRAFIHRDLAARYVRARWFWASLFVNAFGTETFCCRAISIAR
jgi:hypothetical protein